MNKGLSLDGKEYISASRAAEKLNYAQDYIGALIRTGKVPGRMIGRSWYVDYDSLVAHKKNRKSKKQNYSVNASAPVPLIASVEALEAPRTIVPANDEVMHSDAPVFAFPVVKKDTIASSPKTFFRYESDVKPRLPELLKREIAPKKKGNFVQRTAVAVAMITVLVSAGMPWMEYGLPQVSEKFSIGIASSMDSLHGKANQAATILGLFKVEMTPTFRRILGLNSDPKIPVPQGGPVVTQAQTVDGGLVVLPPSTEEHSTQVARIKKVFSDDVSVLSDPSGDSGVITPEFHAGDDTEGYAYVLVPIKSQKR
ncbi:MAG: helix-turn-helix domain-containing protein [Patescibacteria group bacterium]